MRLTNEAECTACMACIDACAHNVLGAEVDPEGYFVIKENKKTQCIECGLCARICPVLNKKKVDDGTSKPYAAWNNNLEQRKSSASGGVFAAIAIAILRKGGSVYGAAINGFDVVHRRITEESELHLLQGSKYQHSNLTGIYKQVQKDLRAGRYVLFSGLGCQVAGLLSFLGGKKYKERLYTIDTICGGLSTMLPMIRLKESGLYSGIKSFRDKENGWQSRGFKYSLKMVRKDGSIENLGWDNLVLNTFSSKLLKRSSCLDCKFTGFHRISDCTIGDFWGDERFKEQHINGLSVMVVHNERIMSVINDADIKLESVSWKEVTELNSNLLWTHQPMVRYFITRHIALSCIKKGDILKAGEIIKPNSLFNIAMRIYLKVSEFKKMISVARYKSDKRIKK